MRVLLLTHRLPYAPNRGDRIRAFHILKYLVEHAEITVDLFSLVHDREEAGEVGRIDGMTDRLETAMVPSFGNKLRGLTALAGSRPLTHVLLDAPRLRSSIERLVTDRPPDLVLAYGSGMARIAFEPPLASFPCVLDLVDVDSLKWAALSETSRGPIRWVYAREARVLAEFEVAAASRARATLVVNERESEALARLGVSEPAIVVPNGVEVSSFRPPGPPAADPRVVFMGVLSYPPNEEAALRLVRSIWPRVLTARPDARLLLLGSQPTRALRQAARDSSIEITGFVEDVRPHLWRSAVSVAPLRTARGVQNKVLEALAAGLPCVVSPAVLDGLPAEVAPGVVSAGDDEATASQIVQLLERAPGERRRRAGEADMTSLHWAGRLGPLARVLFRAAAPAARGL